MCYPKPGPRCSAHALARLVRIREALNSTSFFKDREKFERLDNLVKVAQEEYDATPAGINELARRVRQAPDQKDYKERLMNAVFARKEALKAVDAKDIGDVAHEKVVDRKEQFKSSKFLEDHSQFKYSVMNRSRNNVSQNLINKIVVESQNWMKKLNPEEMEAVSWFTSNGSGETAKYLIGDKVKGENFDLYSSDDPNRHNTPKTMQKTVENLDSALNKAVRKNPVRLFRGISTETLSALLNCDKELLDGDKTVFKEKLEEILGAGKTFSSPNFMSTSRSFGIAASFTGIEDNTVVFEFLAKKAGPASNISAWDTYEQEYILPRNHNYKIHAIKELENDMDETTYIIQLTDAE